MEVKIRIWDVERRKFHYIDVRKYMTYNQFAQEDLCPACMSYDYNEIMLFTGLKDKNGNDIYEGDIVVKLLKVNHREITVGTFKPFEVKWGICGFNLNFMKTHTCKIVGNIYETNTRRSANIE